MDELIRKLGKPKSLLVLMALCSLCAAVALLGFLFHFLGVLSIENVGPEFGKVIIAVFLLIWTTVVICMGTYFIGQLSGKYSDLTGRGWEDLPW